MEAIFFIIFIGLMGGVAVGFQGPLSSLISQRMGMMESVFIVHLGGAVAALVPLVVMGGGKLDGWRAVPWYALGAGLFGVVLISAVSYTIPRLGVATTITLIVAGQLVVGAVLDQFGWLGASVRPLDLSRIVGIAVVFLGVWLMVR